nr:reverse transcriptase domain-containing protein [Tanacetum cinerariifolium]
MLGACPHHGFTELAQIDTFYNGLNDNDQDSLNAAMGGNLLIKESCVTCGGPHAHYNCDATNSNQPSVCVVTGTYNQVAPQNRASNYLAPLGFAPNQSLTSGTLSSNTIPNPKGEMKAITTRSGVAYEGPSIPTNPSPKKIVERETKETTDKEQTNFQRSTAHIQPPVTPIPEPDVLKTLPKPNIPYHSRLNDQKLHEKATNQKGSDFILEEIEAYLKDESISPEIDHADYDPEGDICLIEKLLNNDSFQLPPMDLKQGEVVKAKSSIEEPPE